MSLRAKVKFIRPSSIPKPKDEPFRDGQITTPCLVGNHRDCHIKYCGCQAVGCHVPRKCMNEHDQLATIELESTDVDKYNKHIYVWLCQFCFDEYVRIMPDGVYLISYAFREAKYIDHFFVGGDYVN